MNNKLFTPLAALALAGMAEAAFAQSITVSASSTVPWEAGLSTLIKSLTGPIAATVAVAAFALCTWQIIRGAELSSWVAPMIVAALAVATMVNASDLIETLSGTMVDDFTLPAAEVQMEPAAQAGAETVLSDKR